MPAMHDEVRDLMLENLVEKCNLMLRLKPFCMTHEEVLNLVAPKRDVELLLEASKIADVHDTRDWILLEIPANIDGTNGAIVAFRTRTHAFKSPPLHPAHPVWQPASTPELAELGARVIDWMENRYIIGRRFGMAAYVLKELNHVCTHGSQLTYLMPTVSHLCRRGLSQRMDTWLERFGAFKPVKNAPALTLAMRRATGDAAALLTSVAMLGDGIPEPELGEVEIKAVSLHMAQRPDFGWIKRI